jgi:hypothetical protein
MAGDSNGIGLRIEWLSGEDTRPRRCNLEQGYCGELAIVKVVDDQKTMQRVLCLLHGHEYADRNNLEFPEGHPWAPRIFEGRQSRRPL